MKYAIVTGGARGLGLGIVRALLDENVAERIAVIDRDPAPAPAEIASRVESFTADVCDERQVAESVAAITKRFGAHPDVLCNNAGGGEANWYPGRTPEWISVDLWRRYVELNLNSVYVVTREVVPRMVSGAAICNTSSVAGMLPVPLLAAYGAAKAGVISYTKSLALQLGPAGIRVNAVAPGLIYTRLWEQMGSAIGGGEDKARAIFEAFVKSSTPLGREQTPDDIGRAVSYLCSDRAANVTGQVMVVDGGMVLGAPLRSTRR